MRQFFVAGQGFQGGCRLHGRISAEIGKRPLERMRGPLNAGSVLLFNGRTQPGHDGGSLTREEFEQVEEVPDRLPPGPALASSRPLSSMSTARDQAGRFRPRRGSL